MQQQHLSKLMRLSWQIQKRRKSTRSKSLQSAWAIFQNEDIAVYHLVRRYSHDRYPNKVQEHNLALFQ